MLDSNTIMLYKDGCLKIWDLETEKNISSLMNSND